MNGGTRSTLAPFAREDDLVETDEELEDGCGPGAPRGDNLLNDFTQGEAEAYAELARARGERVVEDQRFGLMMSDGGSPTPFGNVVVARQPILSDKWPAAAHALHNFYAAQPGGPFMLMSAWPTPDLRALDFGRIGHPPLMIRAPGPFDVPAVPGLEITRVTDAATAAIFEDVFVRAYPIPELAGAAPGGVVGTDPLAAPRWHHFLGTLDGKPVATGSAFVDETHVHVEFISALPETRGRGVGFAITAAATTAATDRPAMLISSDLGRSTYDRMGYVTLSRFTLWAGHRRAG